MRYRFHRACFSEFDNVISHLLSNSLRKKYETEPCEGVKPIVDYGSRDYVNSCGFTFNSSSSSLCFKT